MRISERFHAFVRWSNDGVWWVTDKDNFRNHQLLGMTMITHPDKRGRLLCFYIWKLGITFWIAP